MKPYEAAVNMFHCEHARWNQWVLFYFGSIVSIFIIGEKAEDYVPVYVLPLLGCVVSVMWVAVATTLRASTTAWRETILDMEDTNQQLSGDVKAFHIQEKKWNEFSHWKDLKTTLHFWRIKTITSITRLLTLFGIISFICFFLLFIRTLFSCN